MTLDVVALTASHATARLVFLLRCYQILQRATACPLAATKSSSGRSLSSSCFARLGLSPFFVVIRHRIDRLLHILWELSCFCPGAAGGLMDCIKQPHSSSTNVNVRRDSITSPELRHSDPVDITLVSDINPCLRSHPASSLTHSQPRHSRPPHICCSRRRSCPCVNML
jgi:hypothetical protein